MLLTFRALPRGFPQETPRAPRGAVSFTLRGNVANAAAPGSDKAISTYLDGVYIGGIRGSVFDFADIERIEVLRGPQGTLFGRNSTAGAVSVSTRDPSGDFHVRQEFSAGNRSLFRSRTSVDLPQIGAFSAYVTYVHDERRGDVRNLGAGTVWDRTKTTSGIGVQTSPKWLGSKNVDSVFAAVKFEPSDSFKMVYKFDHTENNFTPEARATLAINSADPRGVGGLLTAILATQPPGGGPFGLVTLAPSGKRPDAINNAYSVPGVIRATGHSLTTTIQLTDTFSVKNITAYRKAFSYAPATIAGLDGLVITPALAAIIPSFAPSVGRQFLTFDGNNQGDNKQWSSELQFNYNSDLLTLTFGGLYYYEKTRNGSVPGMPANYAFTTVGANGVLATGGELNDFTTTKSLAGYVQAELHVTPQFDIIGGARLTNDKRRGSHIDALVGTLPFTYENTKPNFSIGLSYKPIDDLLLYGKFANGFVSGGSVAGFAFKPETVRSFEAGVKADLLDRRLRINLALWDAHYNELQTSQGGASFGLPTVPVLVVNAGKLKAYGFELEVTGAPTDGILVGGSLGYTHNKLENPPPFLTVPNGGVYVLGGNPEWTANINAQYESPALFDNTRLVLRADANYRSKSFGDPNPNIGQSIPAFGAYSEVPRRWLLNARASLKDITFGPITADLALWAKNLTNDRTMTFPVGFATIFRTTSYETARSYGVDLIFKM
ncbi:TonB-dependent receptor [Novosphingobium sp. G106]|uniref:TonB-dependent receptor n=1 Tax=Novosphingobium sp. G106 TaxID=2849500 RepID=UPI001C2D1199|nr:TonB-dependent receptor [Novosphingobium sp. G106]MBV1686439.1 TonB-dependent receptor [Novosphingobium sp. G106]